MEKTAYTKPITNEQLIKNYLTPSMEQYFNKKLPKESAEYIKLKICELLKYLILCSHCSGPIPFSNEIDELWHLWILQTQQYHELMKELRVKQFIHHSSNDYPNEEYLRATDEDAEVNREVSFLTSYVFNFGDFSESSTVFWPMAINLINVLDLNVARLNEYLKSISSKESEHVVT